MPPRLLYHNPLTPLYPSNDPSSSSSSSSSSSVCTIRFPQPVRIENLRITPEGVPTHNHTIGSTYPNTFSARVLFNISPSNPVNALSSAVIEYDGRSGWSQDYRVGMPEGVSTRMIILEGRIDRLSLSIYGYSASGPQDLPAASAPTADEVLEVGYRGQVGQESKEGGHGREDWSWVSAWAGGTEGLLRLLDEDVPRDKRETAISCLDLLKDTDVHPPILEQVLDHPTALSYLLLLPSYPPQLILQRLFDEPRYALHQNLRHHLPPSHPLRHLVHGSEEDMRTAAWASLPSEGGLRMLHELGKGDLGLVDKATGISRLARLMDLLEHWEGSHEVYEIGLDMLLDGIGDEWTSVIARKVTPLIVNSSLRGSGRHLPIPDRFSRQILTALLDTASVVGNQATFPTTSTLASPYLSKLHPSDPLVIAFTTQPAPPTTLAEPPAPESREVYRFSRSLHSPTNALVHALTPAQILEALAPGLLASLASAREPLFGLSSTKTVPSHHDTVSASAFAGKVYSSHEFRTRQGAASTTGAPVSGAVDPGAGLGGARLESRPASRHVDDYLSLSTR